MRFTEAQIATMAAKPKPARAIRSSELFHCLRDTQIESFLRFFSVKITTALIDMMV